jgi:ABC-type Fe3+ transport system substrate-binding protein
VAPGGPTAALKDVCEKGKAEGKVVYWGGFDDTINPVLDKFYADYPGIKVELLAFANEDAVARTLAEISAGRAPQEDVQSGSMPVFTSWFDRKVAATDIDWGALGVPKDKINQLNVVRHDRAAFGVAYNTSKVKAADLPSSYAGLLDSKWKGRISVDPRGRPFNTLAIAWGAQATLDYVKLLKQSLSPVIIRGETANLTSVISGEVDISTSGRTPEILEQQAKKAPIDRKFMEIVGTVDNYNIVLAQAPHPNAARCFTAWYSTAGEPWKLEFRKKSNDTVPPGVPAGVKIVSSDTTEQSKIEADVATELGKILTAQ